MTFYAEMKALSDELMGTAEFGAALTVQGLPTAGDPVTGAGASDGTQRTVNGVVTKVDLKVFPESMVQAGDRRIVFDGDGAIQVGEKWINGTEEWDIVQVMQVKPDNSTSILFKALVRG